MGKILITGGAGYIGSHIGVELLERDYDLVVVDNLSNSSRISLDRVEEITGKKVKFYQGDILDADLLDRVFTQEDIDVVIHCAALKAVGESVQKPLQYYHNNISGTLNLLAKMEEHKVRNIIFSSSATVYGNPDTMPVTEDMEKGDSTNPYGWTKSMMEQIMVDLYKSNDQWRVILLRYFNPAGAHESGMIGEDPRGIPNNLIPYITQVAIGKLDYLRVYGDDYDTEDGTGVRDYIHVVDLARGHVDAVEYIKNNPGLEVINLGTGRGYSVLEMVDAFRKVTGREIPYKVEARREGDVAISYADNKKAKDLLGFETKYDLKKMCQDAWNWQTKNPRGYED